MLHLWYILFCITINLSFYIYKNIFQIDKKLTGKNTEKETSDFKRIGSEATLIVKEVSNSYSEALDALKSEWLISIHFNYLWEFQILARYDERLFYSYTWFCEWFKKVVDFK